MKIVSRNRYAFSKHAPYPNHLLSEGPVNPFPGIKVLERKLGREISHRLGSNEGLDMPHRALRDHFGDALTEHVYCYGDSEALGCANA
ncbi:hypothetical protein HSBAA_09610 [Vreelandella sulfidaeris]|uniref:Uncharacterized protein n=1 Tax=Vreelandella sulfidaeris TaxID=115553 RepID=A0A455U1I0_9GAMM|nr:hypothetical protein HSBAA_09610 [Halomonas sulfidaeris]